MFHPPPKNDLVYLASEVLENGAITHGFSTRKGGVSPTPWDSLNLDDRRGDDLANVQENFRRLCTALDTDVQRAVLSRQVHRSDVRRVTAVDCGKGLWQPQDYDSADALVTDVPGIPLIVFSADCNVLLLHAPVRRVIGAAHAGWRGPAAGIAAAIFFGLIAALIFRSGDKGGMTPTDLYNSIRADKALCIAHHPAADCVMVRNAAYSKLTVKKVPAFMSQDIVTKLLREELGFDGIVMTSPLNDNVIENNYTNEFAVVEAVKAGCDLIVLPGNFKECYEALITAVEEGRIDEKVINTSVRRILQNKIQRGILVLE